LREFQERAVEMDNRTKKDNAKAKRDPSSLQGWPGYRTREGRSGLDPLDSRAEGGHMAGVFVRSLITGKLRTKNIFFLLSLAVLGLLCITPAFLAVLEGFQGDFLPLGAWAMIAISGLIGIAMLINLIKNLLKIREN
jgi:hypothetical protein